MDYKNTIGEKVILKSGVTGELIKADEYFTVLTVDGVKKEFPNTAFKQGFLRYLDSNLQKEIEDEILEDKKIEETKAREREERIERAKLEMLEVERTKKRQSPNEKSKNIAYKATYCDGDGMWFRRPCSKECMKRNIKEGRSWCTRSLCSKYLNGEITLDSINSRWEKEKDLCYESRMLEDFSVSAGLDDETYKPRSFVKLDLGRLVVLTTVEPKAKGNERIILGAFLVKDIIKDASGADKAISDPKYRIELTIEEARKMRFWDYYENRNAPDSERWGQGLIRYLSDDLSALILYDMVELLKITRKNSEDIKAAEDFLSHYLNIIGRKLSNII